MLVALQVLQRTARLRLKDDAIFKIAELMAYAMFLNLFMLGAEVFTELYAGTEHAIHLKYLFVGIEGHRALVPFAWAALGCGVVSFVLLLVPATRKNLVTLNIGCLLVYASVYLEKGMGTIVPAFTPDTLGEVWEYAPSVTELRVGVAIFSTGFLIFTLLCKIAVPILNGELATVEHERPRTVAAPVA